MDLVKCRYHEWNANSIFQDNDLDPASDYPISDEELLGWAYLKRKREDIIEKKFSWLVTFDGRHRSGKSVNAITIACIFDKTFWANMDKRLVFSPEEILDQFDTIAKNDIHGAVMIIDEAGATISGSEWYERVQKSILKTTQIFGRYNPVIFMVSPVKELIAGGMRKMFHTYFKIDRYDNQSNFITPYEIQYSGLKNKYIYRKPQINLFGQKITLGKIKVMKPPVAILERYGDLEKERKDKMMSDFKTEMKRKELKEQGEVIDADQHIDYIVKNIQLFASPKNKPNNPSIDYNEIRYRLKVTHSKAMWYKREAERKILEKLNDIEQATDIKEGD